MRYLFILFSLIFSAECLVATAQAGDSVNLISNPSFEEMSIPFPAGWQINAWKNDSKVTEFVVRDQDSYHGRYAITIINHQPNDARVKQTVKVDPNTTYRVSCWVRTKDVGSQGKGANISFQGVSDTSRDISGTTAGWQPLELYLKTGKQVKQVELTLGLGGYGAINQGEASFDQVRFEKVTAVPEGVRLIVLHSKGEPKSRQSPGSTPPPRPFLWILVIISFGIMIAAAGYYWWAIRSNK